MPLDDYRPSGGRRLSGGGIVLAYDAHRGCLGNSPSRGLARPLSGDDVQPGTDAVAGIGDDLVALRQSVEHLGLGRVAVTDFDRLKRHAAPVELEDGPAVAVADEGARRRLQDVVGFPDHDT